MAQAEHEEEEDWNSKLEGYSPHRMKEEGKRQEEELELAQESMELRKPYQENGLLYLEYGTPGNTQGRREQEEQLENRLQRWEDCDDQHNGTIDPACG